MPITIPVPDDATYDYVPIAGPQIQVGTDLLSAWTVRGNVNQIFGPDDPESEELWVFFMLTPKPDGTIDYGLALFPETPSLNANWWGRTAIWRRAEKLADGATVTAADGSKWIYPAGEDGRMRCFASGSEYTRGDQRFRGELTTDPRDLWICGDVDWDWLPITDGSEVQLGDEITFLMAVTGVVDEIHVDDSEAYRQTGFEDASDTQLGWWFEHYQPPAVVSLNVWTWFQRLAKPAADAKFRAPDGSRWIYIGSSHYYCWGAGTVYAPGSVFLRGEIAGGLTVIT